MNEEPEKPNWNRPLECQNCKKECTIHLTQIINTQVKKIHMCATCPKAKKMESPTEFGLVDQLLGPKKNLESLTQPEITCQACSYTETEFKKTGRLGCPYCYDFFILPQMEILRNIHHDITHKGKEPRNQHKKEVRAHIDDLKKNLNKLIDTEDYESAAKLRDEINLLNKELAAAKSPTTKKKKLSKKKSK